MTIDQTVLDHAAELIRQGARANTAGRPGDAERLLRQAIRLLDHPGATQEERELRARATVTLAYPTFERGGLAPALALLDEAAGLLPGPAGDAVRLLGTVQRAGFLGRGGDWAGAVALLVEADQPGNALSPRERCAVRLNRGMARLSLGSYAASRRDLRAAMTLASEHGFADLEFKARHNLGCVEFIRGDLPVSLRLMADADAMDVEVSRATAKLDYARVLLEAGLLDEAAVMLREALAIAATRGLRQEEGEILIEQARLAVIRGEYGQARSAAAEAARMFRTRRAAGWRLQAEVMRVEAELAGAARPGPAARSAAMLSEMSSQSRDVRVKAALLAAEAALLTGELAVAQERFGQARRAQPRTLSARLQHDFVGSRISLARGRRGEARRRLRDAAERLAAEQSRHSSLDTRTALALHGRRLAELDVGVALEDGHPEEVFAATERWRAVSQRIPAVRPRGDEQLDLLSGQLRQAREELRGHPEDEGADRLRARIAGLEQSIGHREWEVADLETSAADQWLDPVGLDEAAALADATGTDLVSYFTHGGRVWAVTLGAGDARLDEIADQAEVAELVARIVADLAVRDRRLDGPLQQLVDRSLGHGLARLDALLAPRLSRERAAVLPSRLMASIPWRMLPSLAGRPLVVAPSATFWTGARATNRPTATATSIPHPGAAALAGPGLARACAEAAAVAAAWGAAAGGPATSDDLALALRDATVVHIAAHGSHHEQSPLFSSVQMADGPLFAYEFQRQGVGAAHVVLSACDVGRAVIRPGEEALGLTASLLASGVTSVVASVAPVADEVAERAMAAYHRALVSGLGVADALEEATHGIPGAGTFCAFGADWRA